MVRDTEKNLLYINPAAQTLIGCSLATIRTKKCFELFGNSDRTCQKNCPVDRLLAEDLQQGKADCEIRDREGKHRKHRATMFPLQEGNQKAGAVLLFDLPETRNDHGGSVFETVDPLGFRGNGARDKKLQLHQFQESVREKEALLELFFTQSLDGFFFMVADTPFFWNETVDREASLEKAFTSLRVTKANDAMLEQYGADRSVFLGITLTDFFAHDLPHGKDVIRQLFDKGRLRVETDERKADGTQIWIEGDYSCLFDDQGRIKGLFGIQREATAKKQKDEERRQQEHRLQMTEKAESLERMAGAIAHHFNNLFAAIMGNLELAEFAAMEPGSKVREYLADAMSASQRAAELSSLMLAYLGQSIGRRQEFDLAEECLKAVADLRDSITPETILENKLQTPGPRMMGDPGLIRKIVTNLLMNAFEALPRGRGTVRISIKPHSVEAGLGKGLLFPPAWKPTQSSYACLEISDTGCGMEPGIVTKIFDPFFTTKFTGRGLGMAVVLGSIRGHHGAVRVESALGKGSTFHVFFPVLKATRVIVAHPPKVLEEGVPKQNTILLIDDEDIFREMCLNLLRRFGFEVLEAKNGQEGVELFRKHLDHICCVLTDLSMPGMNGWDTMSRIRRLKPEVPIILASGYDEAKVMGMSEKEQPQVFLHKPFQTIDLKVALAKALNRK